MPAFGDVLRGSPGVLCWSCASGRRDYALAPACNGLPPDTADEGLPPWTPLVHPDDLTTLRNARTQLPVWRVEYRLRDAAGELCVLECGARLPDGSTAGTLSLSHRNEAGEQALAALQLGDERFRSLARLSSDWLWETDATDRFVFVSEGLRNILGLDPSAVLGRRRDEVSGRPEQPGLAEVRRLVAAREPFRGIRYELRLPHGRHHIEIAGEPHYVGTRFAGYRGIAHDITADVEQARALQRANRRLREILDSTPAGYVETGADGLIRRTNPALCRLAGRAPNVLLGMEVHALFPDLPEAAEMAGEDDVLHAHDYETRLLRDDGEELYVSLNASIEFDDDGDIESMTAFVTDISERKLAEQELERLALNDPVTGLHNRSFVELRLQAVLDTAPRGECNAVMFIDLDRFKAVNDTLGHEAGDALLREIGRRLRAVMRPGDIVARFGGDEFVVIANCEDGADSAATIAAKLCETVLQPVLLDEGRAEVGASIGVSLFPAHGRDADTLFRKADAAMYAVKRSGRNGWRLYDAALEADTPD